MLPRVANRYRLLIHQLAVADRLAHPDLRPAKKPHPEYASGWQDRVAGKLQLKQPHVSKILAGMEPGLEALEHAVDQLKISPLYFFVARPTSPHYRDFVGPHRLPAVGYPALQCFLDTVGQYGMAPPSDQERRALERQEWDSEPTPGTYALFLQALRTLERPALTIVKPAAPTAPLK